MFKMWFWGSFFSVLWGFVVVVVVCLFLMRFCSKERKTGRGRSLPKGETHSNPCKNCCKWEKNRCTLSRSSPMSYSWPQPQTFLDSQFPDPWVWIRNRSGYWTTEISSRAVDFVVISKTTIYFDVNGEDGWMQQRWKFSGTGIAIEIISKVVFRATWFQRLHRKYDRCF